MIEEVVSFVTGKINMAARRIDLNQMDILRMANSLRNDLNVPRIENLACHASVAVSK